MRVALWVSLVCLILSLGGYLALTAYEKTLQSEIASMATQAESGENAQELYSQQQLDEQLAQAEGLMQERIDRAYEEGVEEGRRSILENIKASLSDGVAILEVLRPLYTRDVIVVSDRKFHFVPIRFELRQSELKQENVQVLDSGEFRYVDGEEVLSHKGIDVSQHQGSINWEKVAADGVEFAMIRSIYRGYGSGKLVEDETYDDNMKGALENGIPVGVYVFTQALSEEEVLEEAELAIERAKPYGRDFPMVIDVERVDGATPRMDALSRDERTALLLLFCKTVQEAGYRPYIYYNTEMSLLFVNVEELESIPKWYASYNETLFYPYHYDIWQYTANGSVDGIKGVVDLNLCFEPFWDEE